jgi:hypothetical protein
MQTKDAIRYAMDSGHNILQTYLSDLDDADLLVPPGEGLNPIAWQVGHLIASERGMAEGIKPGSSPALPEGFEAAHPRQPSEASPAGFRTKAEYLKLYETQRAATKALLDSLSDAELGKPSPESFQKFAPTVGSVFMLTGLHELMHVGQFVPLRRKLGKPVVI